MMQTKTPVWQISGGPSNRSYADVFIKYGVGLIGPGDSGPWRDDRDDSEFEGGYVRRFASEVKVGDIVLLRAGIDTICAVGIIASEYLYLERFDEVNGWDLQHGRRVRWRQLAKDYTFGSRVFGANPPRFSRLWNDDLLDYAERFINSPPTEWQSSPLPEFPAEEPNLENVPAELQALVAQAHDLVPLMWDRARFGEHPSEDELLAHFVVPFLYALGWPPENIAVKWRHVDVAVFRSLPRLQENCHFIIEAKRLGAGVEGALDQAKGYAEQLGISCDVVVTDGIRYRMYSHKQDFAAAAYANLIRLKRSATELVARLKRP
jgi:hypothetical protein